MCEAANIVHDDGDPVLPDEANRKFIAARAFFGSGLVVEAAAPIVGLRAARVDRVDSDVARIRAALKDLFGAPGGGLALLHVDHDSEALHGDPEADHWILGLRGELVEEFSAPGTMRVSWDIICADPATGDEVRVSCESLAGVAVWGTKRKDYRVRAVQPIWGA